MTSFRCSAATFQTETSISPNLPNPRVHVSKNLTTLHPPSLLAAKPSVVEVVNNFEPHHQPPSTEVPLALLLPLQGHNHLPEATAMGLLDRFTGASEQPPPPANAPVTVKTADVSVRRKFLQKVYALLTINFAITIGISCAFAYIQPVQDFLVARQWLILVAAVVAIALLLVLVCVKPPYPTNLIVMYAFVLAYSCMIGIIVSAYFDRGWGFAVLQAFVATAAVFVSITAFILVTKKDFSFLYGFLGAALVVLIVLSLFSFLFSYPLNGRSRAFYFGISILGFVHLIPVLLTLAPSYLWKAVHLTDRIFLSSPLIHHLLKPATVAYVIPFSAPVIFAS